jgi:hypothetical protein
MWVAESSSAPLLPSLLSATLLQLNADLRFEDACELRALICGGAHENQAYCSYLLVSR